MPDEDLTTVDALVQLSFLLLGELGRIAASHDLSLVQVRMLGILRDRRPPMLELGRRLDLGKSSMTGLVARAEARGLVRRTPDESDGRGVRVESTEAGLALAAAFTRAMTVRVEEIVGVLSARDLDRLTLLATRVVVGSSPGT
jgi:MarR family transcriptional regulator, lower aerobic nicotinate degradation pathway regulator